jgi:hypothetical protein
MTVDLSGRYHSAAHCMRTLIATEGPRGLVRGLGPSLAAIIPEAAITYGLHDLLKRAYKRARHEDPGPLPSLGFGVLAAWSGQLVSYPLETVSRRLQVAPGGAGGGGQTLRGVLAQILREGGPAGLYRGLGAATVRLIPMAVLSFGTYELARAALLAWETQRDADQRRARLQQLTSALRQAVGAGGGAGAAAGGGEAQCPVLRPGQELPGVEAVGLLPVMPLVLAPAAADSAAAAGAAVAAAAAVAAGRAGRR